MNKNIIQKTAFHFILLLICAFANFLLFSNSKAIDLVTSVVPTGKIYRPQTAYFINSNYEILPSSSGISLSLDSSSVMRAFGDYTSREYDEGKYYVALIAVTSTGTDTQAFTEETLLWYPAANENWNFVSVNQVSYDRVTDIIGNLYLFPSQQGNQPINLYDYGAYSKYYEVTLQAKTTGNYRWQFGDGSHRLFLFPSHESSPVATFRTFQMGLIREFDINSEIAQAEEKTEEATNDGQENANQADTDNEQASQNLLQTAGDIIGAFSSPATNCSISGDLGNVDLGNLNFCQDKPSAIINAMDAIASIIVTFMVFRIIKRLIGRFTSLSAYGQGGSDG